MAQLDTALLTRNVAAVDAAAAFELGSIGRVDCGPAALAVSARSDARVGLLAVAIGSAAAL